MAKIVIHQLVDDLDGSEADENIIFSIDGITYEIDLSDKNAKDLRGKLAQFVAAGRRVPSSGYRAKVQAAPVARGVKTADEEARRNRNGLIRSWFERLNPSQRAAIHPRGETELGAKGRIPQAIVDEYEATNGQVPPVEVKPAVKALPTLPTADEVRGLSAKEAASLVKPAVFQPAEQPAPPVVKATRKAAPRKRTTRAAGATS